MQHPDQLGQCNVIVWPRSSNSSFNDLGEFKSNKEIEEIAPKDNQGVFQFEIPKKHKNHQKVKRNPSCGLGNKEPKAIKTFDFEIVQIDK